MKVVYCSFCGKNSGKVEQIIAGPDCFICNECVELCTQIIAEVQADKRLSAKLASQGKMIVSAEEAKTLDWMRTWHTGADKAA